MDSRSGSCIFILKREVFAELLWNTGVIYINTWLISCYSTYIESYYEQNEINLEKEIMQNIWKNNSCKGNYYYFKKEQKYVLQIQLMFVNNNLPFSREKYFLSSKDKIMFKAMIVML